MTHGQPSIKNATSKRLSLESRTAAVVITYFPDSGFSRRAHLISNQVAALVVVDNSFGSDVDHIFLDLSEIPNVTVLRNHVNLGLATGLNQGCRWAVDQGFEWVLLFDQDSTPFVSMVEELSVIAQELEQEVSTTLFGSNFVDVNSERVWLDTSDHENRRWVDAKTMTTSGTLMPLSAFDALGPFRSELLVDLVDMEYSLRARSQGYRIVASVRPLMIHTVGAKTRRRFLWRTVWPSHHPPLRRYYMARNLVQLVREYGASDPRWAFTEVLALGKALVLVVLYEESKFSKLTSSARGVISGLLRRIEPDST
jgi:rhamnosyltransferase